MENYYLFYSTLLGFISLGLAPAINNIRNKYKYLNTH